VNHPIFGPTDLPGHPGEPAQPRDPQPVAPAHQRGQWPITDSVDLGNTEHDPWAALQAERAERIVILGRIRAHLEEQPNPRAVRAAAGRWGRYITALAEDIVTTMNESARADS
jgi:hypothetical protein